VWVATDRGEIGLVHRVLAPGGGLGMLAERGFERIGHRIECGDKWQAKRTAALFELYPGLGIDQGEQHQPRVGGDISHDPVEMLLRADHRPEVADHLGPFELGERGLGDRLERFAGRVRKQVEVEPVGQGGQGPDGGCGQNPA